MMTAKRMSIAYIILLFQIAEVFLCEISFLEEIACKALPVGSSNYTGCSNVVFRRIFTLLQLSVRSHFLILVRICLWTDNKYMWVSALTVNFVEKIISIEADQILRLGFWSLQSPNLETKNFCWVRFRVHNTIFFKSISTWRPRDHFEETYFTYNE